MNLSGSWPSWLCGRSVAVDGLVLLSPLRRMVLLRCRSIAW